MKKKIVFYIGTMLFFIIGFILLLPKLPRNERKHMFKQIVANGDTLSSLLKKYKLSCQRFPTTKDGLYALKSGCENYHLSDDERYVLDFKIRDSEFSYESDGHTYLLFVTADGESYRWDSQSDIYKKY